MDIICYTINIEKNSKDSTSVKIYSVCNVLIEKLPPQMPRLQQIFIK